MICSQIEDAYEAAFRAAAAVPFPAAEDASDMLTRKAVFFARRHAAEQVLKEKLGQLGLDTSHLSLGQRSSSTDLLSLARPLALQGGK
jgi:hypothetical protein